MRTILIPVSHGHIARNILQTDVLSELVSREDVRVVLLAPDFKTEYYRKEFGGPKVIVDTLPDMSFSPVNRFFRGLFYYFVDTNTVRIAQQVQYLLKGKKMQYYRARFLVKLFGTFPFLRKLVRYLDRLLVKDTFFGPLFGKYNPDLVFVPLVTSDYDTLLARRAMAQRVPWVGMVRSWDNVTTNKGNLRFYPEKLIVHTELLKDEVVHFWDIAPERVEVVGMSHFDYYKKAPTVSREDFFKSIGGDPKKKTILITLIGLSSLELDRNVVATLENAIRSREDLKDVQIIARTHPNETKPIEFIDPQITLLNTPKMIDFPHGKNIDREFTKEDLAFLANALYYSDIVINTQSTTSIDAAAFDKPVINICFDEVPGKPYLESIRRFYDLDHYQPIIRTGGVKLVWNESELTEAVRMYLQNPTLDHDGRERILHDQVPMHDGLASRRTAQAVLDVLDKFSPSK